MEFYQTLLSFIKNKQSVAVITITNVNSLQLHQDTLQLTNLIGEKLLYSSQGLWCRRAEIPLAVKSILLKNAEQALGNKKSKTYVDRVADLKIEHFIEVYPAPPRLFVVGAGHVAKPVVEFGRNMDFEITVICDRPEFATKDQFPAADEVICKPYLDYFRDLTLTSETYLLLLTRGHRYDVMILHELLSRSLQNECKYIGMIGSRRRISGVFSQLYQEFPAHLFTNIFAPVGLDIGAETADEIAISIWAEILKVKNGKTGDALTEQVGHFLVKR